MAAPVNAAKVREGDKLFAEAEKWSVAAIDNCTFGNNCESK